MSIRYSTGLKNALLDTNDLKTLLDDGVLRIYSGTVPADGDAALGAAVLLNEYTTGGAVLAPLTGLNFEAAAVAGALSKEPSEAWQGDAVAGGVSTFFRFVQQADTGVSSSAEVRIQGTVGGVGADLFVQSTTFVLATTYTVDYFAVAIPDL